MFTINLVILLLLAAIAMPNANADWFQVKGKCDLNWKTCRKDCEKHILNLGYVCDIDAYRFWSSYRYCCKDPHFKERSECGDLDICNERCRKTCTRMVEEGWTCYYCPPGEEKRPSDGLSSDQVGGIVAAVIILLVVVVATILMCLYCECCPYYRDARRRTVVATVDLAPATGPPPPPPSPQYQQQPAPYPYPYAPPAQYPTQYPNAPPQYYQNAPAQQYQYPNVQPQYQNQPAQYQNPPAQYQNPPTRQHQNAATQPEPNVPSRRTDRKAKPQKSAGPASVAAKAPTQNVASQTSPSQDSSSNVSESRS